MGPVWAAWDRPGRCGKKMKSTAPAQLFASLTRQPVGMIFTIHRKLETGSWLDYGMFLQNIMTAARARGLDTCAQAAWSQYHEVIPVHVGRVRRRDCRVRHGAGLCRSRCPCECDEDRTRRGTGFHVFPRISGLRTTHQGSMHAPKSNCSASTLQCIGRPRGERRFPTIVVQR